MTWHVFITSPRAGLGFAVAPYTVEAKEAFATAQEAQAFASAKTMSSGVVALLNAMPPLYPAWALNGVYALGQRSSYNGKSYAATVGHTAFDPGWFPGGPANLWTLIPNPGASAWVAGAAYTLPAKATYGGSLYNLVQSHSSQVGWEPPNVQALWSFAGSADLVLPYTRAAWEVVSSDAPDYTERNRVKEA